MLRMAQVNYIKDLYDNEEKSLREISRITGHNFRTVKKYACCDDWNETKLPDIEPKSYPVLGSYIGVIDSWLEQDRKVPKKQRHTAKRIYDRLKDEYGYPGGYTSVKEYIRMKKHLMQMKYDGYIPLEHRPGDAQADFGEFVYYDDNGEEQKGYALTVSFPYSNKGFTQAFPSQNQECLLEGMKRIFDHIGGVPRNLRFDNMSTAVVQVLKGADRVLTDGFQRFMLHYRFHAEFCNPSSGNEKGNVENKVGYSRRNFLVPVPTIRSFEEFNAGLWSLCEKDAQREHYIHKVPIQELYAEDEKALLALPQHPFQVFRYATLKVDKYGFVVVDTNKYGLDPMLNGEAVQAKIYFDQIEFFYNHQPAGRFRRSYGENEEIYDWTQYISLLCKKPRAVENARFFRQLPDLWQKHLLSVHGTERKSALQLLEEIVKDGHAAQCAEALELANENGRTDADSIRQCYYMITRREFHPQPLSLTDNVPALNYSPNLSAYDGLMGGERCG